MRSPLLVILLPALVQGGICDLSYCQCEDTEVGCEGTGQEELFLSSSSLPPAVTSFSLSGLNSLHIKTNAFNDQEDMKEFSLENIGRVTLEEYFYSSDPGSGSLDKFRMENLDKLTLSAENCFENFPRSKITEIRNVDVKEIPSRGMKLAGDSVIMEQSSFTNIRRAGVFVDATTFLFLNNTVDSVATHGFSGNINLFNFSLNSINSIQDEPFQISPLTLEISRNSFNDIAGSPFLSVLPTSVCVPESLDSEYKDDIYRVVSGTVVHFSENVFSQFSPSMLNFPGVDKVPLGSLKISGNKIVCDCERLKDLAMLAEFDELPGVQTALGDIVFKQEFYSTGLCLGDATGKSQGMKMFARENFQYEEDGINCVQSTEKKETKIWSKTVRNNVEERDREDERDKEPSRRTAGRSQPSSCSSIQYFSHLIYFLASYFVYRNAQN